MTSTTPKSLKDAGKEPEKGKWYRLLRDYGSGVGMLKAAYMHGDESRVRMVQVLDIHEPGTVGVGNVDKASPVVRWFEHTPQGVAVHHLQVHMDDFTDAFGAGSEPPEVAELAAQDSGGES